MSRILVADDDPPTIELLKFTLESEGFEVITAYDGVEALKKAEESAPDLILLDVMMPEMDGFQVCQLLKSNPKFKDVPVVLLTAKAQKTDRFWGLEKGANDYITKPFDPAALVEKVRTFLKKES